MVDKFTDEELAALRTLGFNTTIDGTFARLDYGSLLIGIRRGPDPHTFPMRIRLPNGIELVGFTTHEAIMEPDRGTQGLRLAVLDS